MSETSTQVNPDQYLAEKEAELALYGVPEDVDYTSEVAGIVDTMRYRHVPSSLADAEDTVSTLRIYAANAGTSNIEASVRQELNDVAQKGVGNWLLGAKRNAWGEASKAGAISDLKPNMKANLDYTQPEDGSTGDAERLAAFKAEAIARLNLDVAIQRSQNGLSTDARADKTNERPETAPTSEVKPIPKATNEGSQPAAKESPKPSDVFPRKAQRPNTDPKSAEAKPDAIKEQPKAKETLAPTAKQEVTVAAPASEAKKGSNSETVTEVTPKTESTAETSQTEATTEVEEADEPKVAFDIADFGAKVSKDGRARYPNGQFFPKSLVLENAELILEGEVKIAAERSKIAASESRLRKMLGDETYAERGNLTNPHTNVVAWEASRVAQPGEKVITKPSAEPEVAADVTNESQKALEAANAELIADGEAKIAAERQKIAFAESRLRKMLGDETYAERGNLTNPHTNVAAWEASRVARPEKQDPNTTVEPVSPVVTETPMTLTEATDDPTRPAAVSAEDWIILSAEERKVMIAAVNKSAKEAKAKALEPVTPEELENGGQGRWSKLRGKFRSGWGEMGYAVTHPVEYSRMKNNRTKVLVGALAVAAGVGTVIVLGNSLRNGDPAPVVAAGTGSGAGSGAGQEAATRAQALAQKAAEKASGIAAAVKEHLTTQVAPNGNYTNQFAEMIGQNGGHVDAGQKTEIYNHLAKVFPNGNFFTEQGESYVRSAGDFGISAPGQYHLRPEVAAEIASKLQSMGVDVTELKTKWGL